MWGALKVLAVLAFSLVVGGGSAWWMAQRGFRNGGVLNGPWGTNEHIGSAAAGPYLRAGVAVAGLLALNKSETVYYTATTDSDGAALTSNCTYRIEGSDLPGRWWSITAYGADHFLIPNPQKRYAVGKTNVERAADGSFTIRTGGAAAEHNWLATDGAAAAPFSLTIRLYNPAPVVTENLAAVELPHIRKEICR
jgi:hypothetical protein